MGLYEQVVKKVGDIAIPAKPLCEAEEYQFPENLPDLSTEEVGRWMSKLMAWLGYVLRNLAIAELEWAEARSIYDSAFITSTAQVENKRGKTKNQLQAEAVALNPTIISLKGTQELAAAEVALLERFCKIYETQISVLSREISRRNSEIGIEGKVH